MTIYLVAGEASGDQHGAAVMRAIRGFVPEINFIGRGGPKMQAVAGPQFQNWIEDAAVVGLWEVAKNYGYFRREFDNALGEVVTADLDAIVLIDYPGFNLRLARALRKTLPDLKIVYYISPQVWAWNRGRITEMARFLDLMICIFPFEAELYKRSGLRTVFVGHPMIDDLTARLTRTERQPDLIGLFPGSRLREVRKIFPIMVETAHEIVRQHSEIHFEVGAASETLAGEIEQLLMGTSIRSRTRVVIGDAAGIMQRAFVGVIASGTATLEATYFGLPFVLVYKVSWPTYFAARLLIKTEHLGMPNILAGRQIIPEFIQHQARPARIANAVKRLMKDQEARATMISEFEAIIEKLGGLGASERVAGVIVGELTGDEQKTKRNAGARAIRMEDREKEG